MWPTTSVAEPNAFTGAALDRAGRLRRDPEWLAAQRAHPAARAVIAGPDGVAVTGDEPRLALRPFSEAGGGEAGRGARPHREADRGAEAVLLGLDDHGPLFAVEAPGPDGLLGLRDAAALLPQADGGLAAYAAALLNWHRRHGHCSLCGAPTAIAEGGLLRRCPACGGEHHPRTDPVVIMLVTDGAERVLLGRQPTWPQGRYSALAGFVEPGESLEEAVTREVREETGVEIGPPAYVSSQPWPFPSSLMLGFTAPWRAGEPATVDNELEDARWFTRAELEAAVHGNGPFGVPPRLAIARRLIEGWLAAR
jgi:NAD+ diphosphatase